jgi:hypothetical protein
VRNPSAVLGRVPASHGVKLPLFKKLFKPMVLPPFASHEVMRLCVLLCLFLVHSEFVLYFSPLVRYWLEFFLFLNSLLSSLILYTLSLHCLFICINLYRHTLIIIQVVFTLIYLSFCSLLYLSSF